MASNKISFKKLAIGISLLVLLILAILGNQRQSGKQAGNLKLYWFIPDGVRAEPELFNIYEWAKEGKLPNIKKLMDSGSYGYSYPNFPSHTPTNFATLLTGAYPEVHGVNDGPMHALGKPLDKVAVPGFRSVAMKSSALLFCLETVGVAAKRDYNRNCGSKEGAQKPMCHADGFRYGRTTPTPGVFAKECRND